MSVATSFGVELPALQVKHEGSTLANALSDILVDVRVDLELCLPGRAVLTFRDIADPSATQLDAPPIKIGETVEVQMSPSGLHSLTSVFEGTVTSVDLQFEEEGTRTLTVTAHDAAYKLIGAAPLKTHTNASFSKVISAIATEAGVSADVTSATGDLDWYLPSRPPLETLNIICDRLGWDWYVDGKTLKVVDSSTFGTEVQQGWRGELISFFVRVNGVFPEQVTVNGWDRKDKKVITETSTLDSVSLPSGVAWASPTSIAKGKVTTMAPGAISTEEAKKLATAHHQLASSGAVFAEGTTRDGVTMKPGGKLVVDAPSQTGGTYRLNRVTHRFTGGVLRTEFTAGDRRPRSLVDTVAPQETVAAERYLGVVAGVVTDNKDQASLGRVKVKLPILGEEIETDWARVVSLGGGKSRGVVSHPEINDEVLVAFENGDLRQPVVIGGLFNNKDTVPTITIEDDGVEARGLTSRLGHTVMLSDSGEAPKQFIQLQTASKSRSLTMTEDPQKGTTLEIPSGDTLTIKAGESSIVIDGQGNITIKGMKVSIQAQEDLEMTSQMGVKLSSQLQMQLQAMQLKVAAQAAADLEASGMMTIKGATVMIN